MFSAARVTPSVFRYFELGHKNYLKTPLLREQRLRSCVLQDGNLIMLHNEQVMVVRDGLANFSGETAKVGKAIVTNLRFVWYSEIVSNFNVTIPHILLPELRCVRSRRFGKAFFLKLSCNGGVFVYGFTCQPEDQLVEFVAACEKIRAAAARMPMLTLPINIPQTTAEQPPPETEEDLAIVENDPALRYLPSDATKPSSGSIVFHQVLGLSIEALPEGETLSERWNAAAQKSFM
jgi:hypothetical protein